MCKSSGFLSLLWVLPALAPAFFQFGSGRLYAQSRSGVSKPPAFSIKWTDPATESTEDGSKVEFLRFSGAVYNLNTGTLPWYSTSFNASSGQEIQAAFLTETVYQPLTAQEKTIVGRQPLPEKIGPVFSTTHGKTQSKGLVEFIPLRKNPSNGEVEKLVAFNLDVRFGKKAVKSLRGFTYASSSVLTSGNWYKLAIVEDGVYKLDYKSMVDLGIDPITLDPRNIRIYGNGGRQLSFQNAAPRVDDLSEYAIRVEGEQDGVFDSTDVVWFYANGPHYWATDAGCSGFKHVYHDYSDTTFVFLNTDTGPGKRILSRAPVSQAPTHQVNTFDDFYQYENEAFNVVKSGRAWFGELFDVVNSFSLPLTLTDVDFSKSITMRAAVAARSNPPATFSITCQSGTLTLSPTPVNTAVYWADPVSYTSGCTAFNPTPGNFNINVNFQKNPGFTNGYGYLDFIELNYRRLLRMSSNALAFRDYASAAPGNVASFTLSNANASTLILDVSDIFNVVIQEFNMNGSDAQFNSLADTLVEYYAFNAGSNALKLPGLLGQIQNQNLHGLSQMEYVIVAHPLFMQQAQRLADLHSSADGLSSIVVTPQMIYNEFSGGMQDATAIKHFMKMFYDRANTEQEKPKYLLLFGDGSYRNRGRSVTGNTAFIPTYQSANGISYINSYVTDDYFGLLDDNAGEGLTDQIHIGIGRFPVKTSDEAKKVVDKVARYLADPVYSETSLNLSACTNPTLSGSGDWRNVLVFVADDEDNNLHQKNAEIIADRVDTVYPQFNIEKIYYDAYRQESGAGGKRYPDAKRELNQRVNRGAIIVNYTGHGGETGWAEERVLEIPDIKGWTNIDRLPLFVTATCEFSRFDDPARTSAGEEVLLHGAGGGIGLLTTTRLVYASFNQTLNENFFKVAPERDTLTKKYQRIGDISRLTKNNSATNQAVNHRNFTLLADPAIRLNYPEFNVHTLTLNGLAVDQATDTIKALSKITITGEIRDLNDQKMTGFNGVIFPAVFDKENTVVCLANDGGVAFQFGSRKSIIYRGKSSVTGGEFSFTFVVPKDINYQYGPGKLSYYAVGDGIDAGGYKKTVVVGGTNPNAPADTEGPSLELYMNDTKFVRGSITNENPNLLGIAYDENGINTVGSGIGHDIVAVLDRNTEKSIVLNDYYQAELNSYQKGAVIYPFSQLSEGTHHLSLKMWDVYNNSSTAETDFIVAGSENLALQHVLNYPNPFTTHTRFMFEHNKPCETLEVSIQIFTVSGKLVKTLETLVQCEGYRAEDITWDARDEFGDRLANGVYMYRLKVKGPDGKWADAYEKLVILKGGS